MCFVSRSALKLSGRAQVAAVEIIPGDGGTADARDAGFSAERARVTCAAAVAADGDGGGAAVEAVAVAAGVTPAEAC